MKGVSVSDTLINNVFVLTILTRQPRFCQRHNVQLIFLDMIKNKIQLSTNWLSVITPNLTPGTYFLTGTLEFFLFTCLYRGLQIIRLNKRILTSLRNWDIRCTLKERNASPEYDKVVRSNPLHITVESSQIIWNIQYTSVSKYTCVYSIPGGAIIWSNKCELLPCMKENNGSWLVDHGKLTPFSSTKYPNRMCNFKITYIQQKKLWTLE